MAADGVAMFPDAVTARGRRHLELLTERVLARERAVIFFLVCREDCTSFRPAAHIDPDYAATLISAVRSGVELLVYSATVRVPGIEVAGRLRVDL